MTDKKADDAPSANVQGEGDYVAARRFQKEEQAFVRTGRLRVIAVTGAKRSPLAALTPTIAESGVPGYEMRGWNAMAAPRGTSKAVVERLNAEISAIITSAEVRERLAGQGYEPEAGTPHQLGDLIKSELLRYGKLVKAVGMTAE